MISYDVIVIGGGLLGSFAARSLMRYDLNVALLEESSDLCTGISRANTAIVYSGCDTKPGTLKTTMCVCAAQSFAQLCDELDVRYSPCGSIMVTFGELGAKVLQRKYEKGCENGVRDMRLLSRDEVLALEPNIAETVHSGLYVPDTGTVMPWELCLAAAENALDNGAEIVLNTKVAAITRVPGGFEVQTNNGSYRTRGIINCAGMSADRVLEMTSDPIVRIAPTAADYFVLDTKAAGHIRHVIFHETDEKGKGVTLVPTVDGNILIGPTERPNDGESFATSASGLEELRSLAEEVMPTLPLEHIIRSFGAARPNPRCVEDDRSVNDFSIIETDDAFISLIGIKTPGLTCANELGLHVADTLAQKLGATINPRYNPRRVGAVRLRDLDLEERGNPGHDASHSRIVCRCRGVTEGEIIAAIHRRPGAVTLDGIKRRTGAGSGRCQGGFCSQRVIEILARELNCAVSDITKSGIGSQILCGDGYECI